MEIYFLEALPQLPPDLVAFSEANHPKAARFFHCNSQPACSTSTCTCCQQGSEPGWEGGSGGASGGEEEGGEKEHVL